MDILQEVGRVTIAGARLDLQVGQLWHHLDRSINPVVSRKAPAGQQEKHICELANRLLNGQMRVGVLEAMDQVRTVRDDRNEIIHQDWILRGPDSMRPVLELVQVLPQDRASYLDSWQREAMPSPDWRRVPSRKLDVDQAQPLNALEAVERQLSAVAELVESWSAAVASSRDTGEPQGYVRRL